jgi:hypothetical protein
LREQVEESKCTSALRRKRKTSMVVVVEGWKADAIHLRKKRREKRETMNVPRYLVAED